jgi:hypothetical protein
MVFHIQAARESLGALPGVSSGFHQSPTPTFLTPCCSPARQRRFGILDCEGPGQLRIQAFIDKQRPHVLAPLLLRVDYPHVVNPDPVLKAHAESAGWPIHTWK